jgi:hypothetical protein
MQLALAYPHAQDNKGVLQTYNKLLTRTHIESRFIAKQQLRPVWRRIRAALADLPTTIHPHWKRGHSDNPDINAADKRTKKVLTYVPPAEAGEQFPDLLPFVEGMDEMSLLWTFHPQQALPVAHPALPEQNPDTDTSAFITMRQDGNRAQTHNLWTHLQTYNKREKGDHPPLLPFASAAPHGGLADGVLIW